MPPYRKTCRRCILMVKEPKRRNVRPKKRQQTKEKDQKTTERLLRIAEGKAAQGRRISGSNLDAIFRSARRAFELTPNMMQEIFETAKEDGWSIVQCDGEADVHIGSLGLTANAIVVSGDSDLLFYENIHHILRPAKQGYLFYKKSHILELLNMTSPQWTCVGVVSGNDYDPNITGLGIATNCTLVKNIKQDTVKDILTCYLELDRVKAKNQENIAFSKAYKIFGTKKQELVDAVVETSEKQLLFHQNTMKSKLLKIKQLQQQQQKSAKDAKERKRINADGIATHPNEDGLRYTFKEFSEFKKASQIPSAYKMYKAKPDTLGNKKRKKEKEKKKAKAEPSGRSKLKLDNAPGLSEEDMVEEPVKKRKMNESRKLALDLKRKHPTVTLNVGNVATNIRRAIPNSKIQEKVLNTIQSMAGIMNESKKLAQMATIYGKDGGNVYLQNLLRCYLSGNKESMDFDQIICNLLQVAKVDSDIAIQMAKIAFQLLMRCYEAEKLEYQNLDTVFGKLTLGRTLAMLITVVGIDLGEVVTAAACAINLPTNTAATLRNLTIKRKALYQATLKLRTIMEKEKLSAVCMAENAIGSIKNHSFSAAETLVQTWISKYGELRNFYRTRKFKQLIANGKRSCRGEFDVATNALLKMIGGHIGKKRDSDEQVVFAVGLGDFNTHTKLSSLHTSFGHHFINK
ncbi:hypothetical protein BGW37DRAFT_517546 [Umbelopsis sp. PMI_123]|nr:hypothetical protein BGW37DRAFT_517546 [Umbelopsis sp. PMI_123]